MRLVTRIHVCIAIILAGVLYLSWVRLSVHIGSWTQHFRKGSPHRLVVFGDDWSDVGEYRASSPSQSMTRDRDPDQGPMWTETLCRELGCDSIDNFARSTPPFNLDLDVVGSVVQSSLLTNDKHNETVVLFDFAAQVQQFIDFEKLELFAARQTTFTVSFGIWDVLAYSTLDRWEAVQTVNQTVAELIRNLNILSHHTGAVESIRVVMPTVIDVTLLPYFRQNRNFNSSKSFATDQRKAVFLSAYWNEAVSEAIENWQQGEVYMPDMNSIVLDQVRANQLYSMNITDAHGEGKNPPLFNEVQQPCLSMETQNPDMQAAAGKKCSEPADYLFWDNININGPAHQLIGRQAASLVRGKTPVNFVALAALSPASE